jgi:flagellar biosynthesis protein FlhG
MVVATPEPTSLTDAYATIKVLAAQQQRSVIKLLVNQVARLGEGRAIRTQLQQVVDRFVSNGTDTPLKLELVGDVPTDVAVREAVQRRQLMLEAVPGCAAATAIVAIAEKLVAGSSR